MTESNSPHSSQQSLQGKDKNTITTCHNTHEDNSQSEIQKYINEKKELYTTLMEFLEQEDDSDQSFKNLINLIHQQKLEESREKLEEFLILITNVANNHHREKSLFKKLFQIIQQYESQIKQTYSNFEIYNIFESNKMIVLFLFEREIITIDAIIYDKMCSKYEGNGNCYSHFFYPEIKKFLGDEKAKNIGEELLSINSNIFDHFDEKRHEGENDSFICSLIRSDSIEKFIEYVHQKNISLKSEVKSSIFETNSFLNLNKNTTLIEYAAFFGSIQIFNYLMKNEVNLDSSLWLYSIHSRNAELIQILESNKISPPDEIYEKCMCESIKCHHNEFADYFENNFLQTIKSEEIFSSIMQSHNYSYFPSDYSNGYEFYYLCSNNYNILVKLFLKMNEESIKQKIEEEI